MAVQVTDYSEQKLGEPMKVREVELTPEQLELARTKKVNALVEERQLALAEEERVLLTWKAPARPYKQHSREYYTTVGAIVILVSVILVFAREFLAVAVVLALLFMVYALVSVKPEEVEHQVSTRGIRTGGKFFRWDVLGRYWVEARKGSRVLMIETSMRFPTRLMMLLAEISDEKMKSILGKYLLNETPEPTVVDKSAKWLAEKVPLDDK